MQASRSRILATTLFLVAPLACQWQPYGSEIISGPSGTPNTAVVSLGFNFIMPGGVVVSSVEVDEDCRIFEVGQETSDGSESTAELVADMTGLICVHWDFTSFNGDNSSVWFSTDGATVAAVTWVNVRSASSPGFTLQVQLHADGRITYLYDSRFVSDTSIIGVSPGRSLATLPAATDLSAIGSPLATADQIVYEQLAANDSGLASTSLEFVPNGVGGTSGWTVFRTPGIADPTPPFFASNEIVLEDRCPRWAPSTPISYIFQPDGSGGYDVSSSASVFNPNIGASLGQLDRLFITVTNLDLGFAFPWPGGLSEQFVRVDSSGRILPESSMESSCGILPAVSDLTGAGYPMLCPFYCKLDPESPGSGSVHFESGSGSARFTWNNVHTAVDAGPFNVGMPVLFQLEMFPTGTFIITHEDIDNWDRLDSNFSNLIVGCATGASIGSNPPIDLTTLTPAPINAPTANVYQFSNQNVGTNLLTAVGPAPEIAAFGEPFLGTIWSVQVQDIPPSAALGFYLVGFTPTVLSLEALGTPCQLGIGDWLLTIALPNGLGDLDPLDLPIPVSPSALGISLLVQGMADGADSAAYGDLLGLGLGQFTMSPVLQGNVGDM